MLVGNVESGRIYATHQMRVLVRAAAQAGSIAALAKWAVPLLIEQLKDKCRAVVVAATDVLDEATDDSVMTNHLTIFTNDSVDIVSCGSGVHRGAAAASFAARPACPEAGVGAVGCLTTACLVDS